MKFQRRLLITYSMLVLLLVMVLALLFYHYSSDLFVRNALDTHQLLSHNLSSQLDSLLQPMDFITANLISDAEFKSSLATLNMINRGDPVNTDFIAEAQRTVRNRLVTYSIVKNFYAAVVLNREQDFFSSNFIEHLTTARTGRSWQNLPWVPYAEAAAGRVVTLAPFPDPWDTGSRNTDSQDTDSRPDERGTMVFGRGRAVQELNSNKQSYLLVLNRVEKLDSVFTIPDQDYVRILAFLDSGETLYRSGEWEPALEAYYKDHVSDPPVDFFLNKISGRQEALLVSSSPSTGTSVMLILDRQILLAPLTFSRNLTVGIGLLLLLVSFVYNVISSRLLTRPLRLITVRMEETELSNLSSGEPLNHDNDEISALDHAFISLRERLDQSIHRELDSRTLWLKARFDSLQAQVDPHFINNILAVIAGRGLELGDRLTGDICDGVATMLRYSTSNLEGPATLGDELAHLKTYLFLMKQRFEDRLEYTISMDSDVLAVHLPRIVLQPIVENSFAHGNAVDRRAIRIEVSGLLNGDRWMFELQDNGNGFSAASMEKLRTQIRSLQTSPDPGILKRGLDIGGFGLISTYARLYLFYHGDVDWEMGNRASGGAFVRIGGPLSSEVQSLGEPLGSSGRRDGGEDDYVQYSSGGG